MATVAKVVGIGVVFVVVDEEIESESWLDRTNTVLTGMVEEAVDVMVIVRVVVRVSVAARTEPVLASKARSKEVGFMFVVSWLKM